ncbi:nucleotidyl transferase AbiEii/AbiGii toxin family protein [Hazenella coriacea]|uniref:Nucleotidyltransferase AbiEii toxin of type IV toxin-antitoxin system n=1 Tax=Hazenella coriacea TaxID=1179467 RepID=A0A4R3L7B8_9BACL|nr:nucleotidyl transferase AbiEii/AbiGii toxin family protein [Hazenella coriacea]TCS94840.1 nucleotidyltransferase AbiEii toxin of type IV toxin-antitoxin system [Hazenella coriacea]
MIKREDLKDMNYDVRELVVLEALLRRISLVNMPFILKGSLLTRQYLDHPDIRYVDDIDFLYMGKIKNEEHAHKIFTNWMIQVTEMDLHDGIKFRSFRENAFWRRIDYAMADDFPTINTDLAYYFTDESREATYDHETYLDISFNLEMEVEPVSLEYQPVFGDRFIVPYSVPLSIQVAWKLHQTIVRPRFKDLYDLKYLISHPAYNNHVLKETLQTLINECSLDQSITKTDIKKVLVDDLSSLYHSLSNDYFLKKYAGSQNYEDYFMKFVTDLRKMMDHAGINESAYDHLPSPTYKEL